MPHQPTTAQLHFLQSTSMPLNATLATTVQHTVQRIQPLGRSAQIEPTPLSLNESQENQGPPPRSSAPSPAPTEIIPLDLLQDEIVEDIQKVVTKVRDFAYEDVPTSQCAIELFDPLQAWYTYETAFTYPAIMRIAFPGKITRRLLDIGWLKREEEEERWSVKDRDALEAYDRRTHYPWRSFKLPKPHLDSLAMAWRTRFQQLTDDEPPPMPSRSFSQARSFNYGRMTNNKRCVTDEQEMQNENISPQTKKRRLEDLT